MRTIHTTIELHELLRSCFVVTLHIIETDQIRYPFDWTEQSALCAPSETYSAFRSSFRIKISFESIPVSANTTDQVIKVISRFSAGSSREDMKVMVTCAHCGSSCSLEDKNCTSCGSPIKSVVYTESDPATERRTQNKFVGFLVWLCLGLIGGFAYWSGEKIKAYLRVLLWVILITSVVQRGNAQEAGSSGAENLFFSMFGISLILIIIFWLLDLVRLLKH